LIHAFSLFVLKTEMVTNAKINLKPPSFVKKYYGNNVTQGNFFHKKKNNKKAPFAPDDLDCPKSKVQKIQMLRILV